MMTHKGVYPSLKILLEANEDTGGTSEGDEDFSFEDEDQDEESSDSTEESPGESDASGESGKEDAADESGKEDGFEEHMTLSNVEKTLVKQQQVDSKREKPTPEEAQLSIESNNMIYSFKEMALINEDTDIESLNKKVDAQIKANKEKYEMLDQQLASSSSGVDYDIDELVEEAIGEVEKFNYDEATIVAKLKFMKLRSSGKVEHIEEKSKEFAEKFYQALKQKGIKHALPDSFAVNSIDNTSYNIGQGAKSQS